MRLKWTICVFSMAAAAFAGEPKAYQSGKLVQMDSVSCGMRQNDSASANDAPNADHESQAAHACQEYVLESEQVMYRIRPRDAKHARLLPIGSMAEFRLEKDKMLVRIDDPNSKETEYIVVSMNPRTEGSAAEAKPAHINHLQ